MIQEAYCSFEVAKSLKEKGFDVYGDGSFGSSTEIHREYSPNGKTINTLHGAKPHKDAYPAPTQQMAMAWLREEKNILIYVYPVINLPIKDNNTFHWQWDGKKKRHYAPHIGDKHNYESYEEAVEAALKYCLENLI